jgi:hypothetical protein
VKDATGGLSFTVSVVVPDPGPALFVAVTVMVNVCDFAEPVEVYMCVSDVAVPARVLVVPSPQLTVIPVTVAVLVTVKVTVTVAPVFAGFGVGLFTVTVGPQPVSTVVTELVAWPVEPLLSVAVTVRVNVPPTM